LSPDFHTAKPDIISKKVDGNVTQTWHAMNRHFSVVMTNKTTGRLFGRKKVYGKRKTDNCNAFLISEETDFTFGML